MPDPVQPEGSSTRLNRYLAMIPGVGGILGSKLRDKKEDPASEGSGTSQTEREKSSSGDATSQLLAAQFNTTLVLEKSATLPEALEQIVTDFCQRLALDIGQYWSVLPEEAKIHCVGSWQSPDAPVFRPFELESRKLNLERGDGFAGRVWKAGDILWLLDASQELEPIRSKIAFEMGLRGGFGFPVAVGGKVLGILEFFSRKSLEQNELFNKLATVTGCQIAQFVQRRAKEEALNQAKEAAEAANRAKSDFISRMSHELRTPLNAILGFSQLLRTEDLTPAQQARIDQIIMGGNHLLDLINEILDIARIEAGRLSLALEPVSLQELFQESIDLMVPLASQRNIKVVCDPLEVWSKYVLADRQRLKQVLLNLLDNAIKYNRHNGTVRLTCDYNYGTRAAIRVSDTGRGIPPSKIGSLFAPFNRLGAEISDVEGTGLGLALSKRLVEAMGGTIVAESSQAKGTTMCVSLLRVEPRTARMDTSSANAAAPRLLPNCGSRTVLYVEDNLSNLNLMRDILSDNPAITLVTATRGSYAAELAKERVPDVVLLDLNLPDITGYDVLKQLQQDALTRHIPVIMISADATQAQIQRLKNNGARAYLTKPINLPEFIKTLEQLWRENPRPDSAAQGGHQALLA